MSHINKAIAITRNDILNKSTTENDEKIPLIVTFNSTLLDLGQKLAYFTDRTLPQNFFQELSCCCL